eukprot:Skav227583  [mRNA]  locus=scaffold1141:54010:55371:+ [translate_table: standard]
MGPDRQSTNMCQVLLKFWPLLLGNILEWYDFGIYSFLAPNMKEIFFHSNSVSTWAGYAVTFLLRPLGGLLNGWLADKYGRRVAVLTSIIGMLVATVGQGLLPTFLCCGDGWGTFGLVMLLLFRALQGLSAGGELGPIVAYFAETAPPNRICAATGLLLASAGLGFLSANLLVVLVVRLVGQPGMAVWGWRIPFLVSVVPGAIALWGRSKLTESAEFVRLVMDQDRKLVAEERKLHRLGLRDGRAVLVGFLSTCSFAVSYYSGLWCPSYLQSVGLDQTSALLASCVLVCVATASWLVWPWINDVFCRIDPINIVFVGSLALAMVSFPLFYLLSTSSNLRVMSMVLLGVYGFTLGIAGSHTYAFVADLFPIRLRALGFGTSFNAAMAFVGGSTPLINAAILEARWPLGVGLFWSLAGVITSLATAWGIYCRRSGDLPSHLLQNEAHTKPNEDEVC